MPTEPVAFGPFSLDTENGTLWRDGERVPIGRRAVLLLSELAKTPGRVQTKQNLMNAAWPGTAVEESNLSVQMATLRKVLGPTPDGGEWIETIPRVGYRFVAGSPAKAEKVTTEDPDKQGVIPVLAVLPFLNLGGGPEQDYFADGIVEDIITALSRFKSFAVIARNSSFVFKGRAVDVRQVAKELNVRYVLEGSVRRSADRLRITAQLVDGTSGTHLWADRFDGSVGDVFDVQDHITESVATIVEPQIREAEIARSRQERPGSIAAYDLYLQALSKRHLARPEANAAAYALLSKAIELEPTNGVLLAQALDTLQTHIVLGWPALTNDDKALCGELVHAALANAHEDAAVLAKCAIALIQVSREYDLGLATLQRAVELNPNNLDVMILAGIGNHKCGRPEEALAYFHRALQLSPADPFAFVSLTGVAHVQMSIGDYSKALAYAERSLAIHAQFSPTYWILISGNAQLGHMDEARRWLDKFRGLEPGMTIARISERQPDRDGTQMAAVLEGLRLAGLD